MGVNAFDIAYFNRKESINCLFLHERRKYAEALANSASGGIGMKRFLKLIAIAVAMAMFAVIPLSACGNGGGASEAQKYRVSFSAGVVGDDAVTGMPSAVEVENGGTAQRPEEIPSRDGFTFKNWYTEASGGSVFDFENTAITKDTTVYAQWQYAAETPQDPADENEDYVFRIACVGDSLTYGNASPSTSYPVYLSEQLGDGYNVGNFGRNGASITGAPDGNPAYATLTQYEASLDFNPDAVLIMLGTNDAQDWANASATYENDLKDLIRSYQVACPGVTVILMTSPLTLGENQYDIVEEDIENYVAPIQREVAQEMELQLVDVREAMKDEADYESFFISDKVHLTPEGGQFIAGLAADAVEEACADMSTARVEADLVLFIGQSNMAGRGDAEEATEVEAGHAYEFRAISDPSRLYSVTEPFGVNENNAASGVSESTKTGSMVSAFCESYYAQTGTPIVAVSCSKGGTAIDFWDTDGAPYRDAVERVKLAQSYMAASEDVKLRNTYVVWLQGESDGDAGTSAADYNAALGRIFDGFEEEFGADHFFVIPIGAYNGNNASRNAAYTVIRDAQTEYCEQNENATVISIQLYDFYEAGLMKDTFHYYQTGYEIVGADAGSNMGYFVRTGEEAECEHYDGSAEVPQKTGGAWQEENGRVVINTAAALENSPYASVSSRYTKGGSTLFSWTEYTRGFMSGMEVTPDVGTNQGAWNRGTGYERAPQMSYTFNVSEAGTYYLYLLTSYPDQAGNSVMANMDGGTLIDCATSDTGSGKWVHESDWAFELTAGEHTLTICAREDGAVLHQVLLSKNAGESLKTLTAEEESERAPIEQKGAYVETKGTLCIDTLSALENSEYCWYENSADSQYYWERSSNGSGIQTMPRGKQWSAADANSAPKATYTVDFATAGTYHVYLYVTFMTANVDSAMISVDDGEILEMTGNCIGNNRWLTASGWDIEIDEPGVHTITLYARESGGSIHKIFLAKDNDAYPVGAASPSASPRLSLEESAAAEKDGVAFVETNAQTSQYTVDFATAGNYIAYACVEAGAGGTFTLGSNDAVTFGAAFEGWKECGTVSVSAAGEVTLQYTANNVQVRYLYLVSEEVAQRTSVKTLVIGDSYTNKTYWEEFDSQMAEIEGITIGVSGSTVSEWQARAENLALYNPENIVIHIGINDILGGTSGTDCSNDIIQLINSLRSAMPDTKIFYVSICNAKSADSSEKANFKTSNEAVKAFIEGQSDMYFIDYAAALDEEIGSGSPDAWFRSDNLHPSAQAYVLFSGLIVDAVKEANGGAQA